MIGLDRAGKTSLTFLLKSEIPVFITPTYGFTSHDIPMKFKNYQISIFDLGGSATIRGYWDMYYTEVHGVIFVIDASDTKRFDEVRRCFQSMLGHAALRHKPILIICNKYDLEQCTASNDIALQILNTPFDNNPFKIIKTSVFMETDDVLSSGLMFLLNYIDRNYNLMCTDVQTKENKSKSLQLKPKSITLQKQRVQLDLEQIDDIDGSDHESNSDEHPATNFYDRPLS
eukprot:CAMPEP_0202704600 /NCGR_PEP_ID=MMETSP1385-20130828/17263_1 /ASSEMBLY_ACC=CAM_ASM_000861 /TAXON_ID=933848 /ORGANISM="Elphidium margaritaceum" /LENGTH=228 /DNA_ID=CAMNT_0049362669 /DNA_START=71 /DNA_END=754 /DNA_ORIENTATION=-